MTIAAEVSQLAGLELDTVDGRYKVTTHLELRGRETPNPEGRLYLVSRPLAYGRPRYFRPGSEAPALAHGLLDGDLIESILIRDNTLAVVRRSGVSWDAVDAHVDRSLRRYFLHCGMALAPAMTTRPSGASWSSVYSPSSKSTCVPGCTEMAEMSS